MALKKEVNGKTIYARVDRAVVGKSLQYPDFIVCFYYLEGGDLTRESQMSFSFQQDHPAYELFTPEALSEEGNNPLKAMYSYLKSTPLFEDFEDA